MADVNLTFDQAFARFEHLEDLIHQLDDAQVEEAFTFVGALLDRDGEVAADRLLLPVQRPARIWTVTVS